MLRYQVRGENLEITQPIREYVENKVSKLEKYFAESLEANVYANAKVYKNSKKKIEITVPLKGVTLRAEEVNEDLYAAVDLAVDKLERQMRKHKTKINRKGREKGFINENLLTSELVETEESTLDFGKVKQLTVELMTREEAVIQMELLGHDFFAFLDAKTNEISIVYKRRDTGYGVLEISK
ncbi:MULTISPECIES: ribosome hibernation-promoting factor, HPF/YfiA family [Gemella]|uniref:ribosome hibernation-promoting factor, HPF/YfiA family n=1 Tax=Gemella TaxID=1378 RepID=UPI000767EC38|nr:MULTISPECIES: ribosome-associated translation inhibitor RaiA [Gemella]AME10061.1 Fis family transcriptional regulator [Gemella sp. oral taxon 928]AXI26197.1 ribosomal subunit interface protein [Gemella sp. ND 6198]